MGIKIPPGSPLYERGVGGFEQSSEGYFRVVTTNQLIEKDQVERNTRWIVFSRIAVVSYFLGVTIFIQFRAVRQLPEEYLWTSYFLISAIYIFSVVCLVLPRTTRYLRMNIAIQSVFDVFFVTGIVLVTGGIDSVYSVLYSLVIIYSTLFMGRKGGLSIAALSSLCYVVLINLDISAIYEFLYDEGIVPRGELTRSYILTRAITHVASFFLIALLTSFVVEQERKTKRLLAEKATAFDRLDLLHRSIIESVDTGILTVNLEGHIRSFNRAAEEISGYAFGEVGNRSIEEIFPGVSAIISPLEPDERKRQRKRFEIVIRKKSGESMILGISEFPPLRARREDRQHSHLSGSDLLQGDGAGRREKQTTGLHRPDGGGARTRTANAAAVHQRLHPDPPAGSGARTDGREAHAGHSPGEGPDGESREKLPPHGAIEPGQAIGDGYRPAHRGRHRVAYLRRGVESPGGAPQNPRPGAAGDGRSRRDSADPLESDDQRHAVHAGRGHAQRHRMPRRGSTGRRRS